MQFVDIIVTPFLAVAAIAYAGLAVYVARSGPQPSSNMLSVFLALVAGMIVGAAFSYGTDSAGLYGLGRAFSFVSSGFVPIVFFLIYREYTAGPPGALVIAMLCIIPVATTGLVLTNSMHNMIWAATEHPDGLVFSNVTDHAWYTYIFAPYLYGLFAYSGLALLFRLPTIAAAHRKTLAVLLLCALLPFGVSITNTFLGIGAPEFPHTAMSLALLWPFVAFAGVKLRMHEFSPLAYQTLFDHVRDPVFVVDNEQCIVCANKAAQLLLQGKERELIGRQLWEDFPAARAILEQAKELDLTQTLQMNTSNVYEVSVSPLTGTKGQNLGMVVVCRDVTERREALSKLANSEHLIRTLIETSSNGILRFARDHNDHEKRFRCVYANLAAGSFSSDGHGTLVGMLLEELDFLGATRLQKHFGGDERATTQISFEVRGEAGRGGECWLRIAGEPVGDDFSVTLIDITQRKLTEDKMLADALRDPLTGVLNRRGFDQHGALAIQSSSAGAVLYLDLNQFKAINDRFGHQAGDALLKAFAHRLEFCLRPEDILGRLGGDEFAIVLPGVNYDDVKHVAGRLVQTASEAYIIQGQEIKCSASVGIALLPKHGDELWHLLGIADQAMYNAKSLSVDEAANDRAAYVKAATAS